MVEGEEKEEKVIGSNISANKKLIKPTINIYRKKKRKKSHDHIDKTQEDQPKVKVNFWKNL